VLSADLRIDRRVPTPAAGSCKKDPQCVAKQAIARSLVKLKCTRSDFFIAGLAYRQPEPGWGGATDTAAVKAPDA
jgi:hypothetical protein